MKAIAIITARGGSKRIPRKNIKDFCGKPIICYSIEAALNAGIFDEVMVSTNDREIADIAINAGAKVPFFRSEATSGDYAATADVLLEVLDEYEKRGKVFEHMACIYPTAPFISADKLKAAYKKFIDNAADVVMPIVRFSFPPQRCLVMNGEFAEYKWRENFNCRSQDLEAWYHDCGQFYFYNAEAYKKCRGQFLEGIVPFEMPEAEVQDIDNEDDWKIAEIKYQLMNK